MKLLKTIAMDTLGVVLILAAILFGWLPGIGGIPLFLVGLSLLAINHTWAKRLLTYAKERGMKLLDILFNEHPAIVVLYDIATVLLAGGGVLLLINYSHNAVRAVATLLFMFSLGLFLGNRKRLLRILRKIQRKTTPKSHKQ